jgi:hypothetical protein
LAFSVPKSSGNEEREWCFSIPHDDLEEVQGYVPGAWNNYPEVQPPEDILMRVECKNGKKTCAKFHVFDDGGCWCDPDGTVWPLAYSEGVKRFRSWE